MPTSRAPVCLPFSTGPAIVRSRNDQRFDSMVLRVWAGVIAGWGDLWSRVEMEYEELEAIYASIPRSFEGLGLG